jgi:hypothetical protein
MGRVVNVKPQSLYPTVKNACTHNEQEAGLNVSERRAILLLCHESNQNSSYIHLHSLVIIPITPSRLVGKHFYYSKLICEQEMKEVITLGDS